MLAVRLCCRESRTVGGVVGCGVSGVIEEMVGRIRRAGRETDEEEAAMHEIERAAVAGNGRRAAMGLAPSSTLQCDSPLILVSCRRNTVRNIWNNL